MAYTGLIQPNYQLQAKPFTSGGEGEVYHVIDKSTSKKVAKIYLATKITKELENKLKYMINNPPDPDILNQVAWPQDVLYDVNNKFCGFIMPELKMNAELKELYQYPPVIGLSARNKIIIAENICAVISAVHNAGYVFGDFNPRNIGVVKESGKVAFLDTDSYHVFDKAQNKQYRCKVCLDGYAAPELLEACANHAASHPNDSKMLFEKIPLPTFTKETDNFALAIHIFKLLMNGFTPFGGIIETITPSQASPSMGNAAIRRNEYSFKPGNKPMSPAVPPLDIFPPEIADLFTKAFLVTGTINPSQRPTPVQWHQALTRYENTLVDCSVNGIHQYDRKNKSCPYCEADRRYNQSISIQKVQTPPSQPVIHLQQKTYSQPRPVVNIPAHSVQPAVQGSIGSMKQKAAKKGRAIVKKMGIIGIGLFVGAIIGAIIGAIVTGGEAAAAAAGGIMCSPAGFFGGIGGGDGAVGSIVGGIVGSTIRGQDQ